MHSSLKVFDLNNAMNEKKGYSAILSEQGMHSQRWKGVREKKKKRQITASLHAAIKTF